MIYLETDTGVYVLFDGLWHWIGWTRPEEYPP